MVVRQGWDYKVCPLPFLDVLATKPPLVLLDSWADLMIFMDAFAVEEDIADRRHRLAAWSDQWWLKVAPKLDAAVASPAIVHKRVRQKPSAVGSSIITQHESEKERLAALAASIAVRARWWLRACSCAETFGVGLPAWSPFAPPPALLLRPFPMRRGASSHSLIGANPLFALIAACSAPPALPCGRANNRDRALPRRQLARGKLVESEMKKSYSTLLHMTGMNAACTPPDDQLDATVYFANVAECVKMLLSPDAVSTFP